MKIHDERKSEKPQGNKEVLGRARRRKKGEKTKHRRRKYNKLEGENIMKEGRQEE